MNWAKNKNVISKEKSTTKNNEISIIKIFKKLFKH